MNKLSIAANPKSQYSYIDVNLLACLLAELRHSSSIESPTHLSWRRNSPQSYLGRQPAQHAELLDHTSAPSRRAALEEATHSQWYVLVAFTPLYEVKAALYRLADYTGHDYLPSYF